MAVTEEQFKARFRERFKTIALSNKTLDALAAKVAPTLPDDTDDAGIDAHLDFLNGLHPDGAFLAMQKADDKTVNDKKKQEPPKSDTKPKDAEPPKDDDTPAWAKALMLEVQTLKTEKQQATLKQQADNLLKDVSEKFRKYAYATMPKEADALEAWAEEVKADYTADLQQGVNRGLGDGKTARGNNVGNKEASQAEIEAAWAEIKPS